MIRVCSNCAPLLPSGERKVHPSAPSTAIVAPVTCRGNNGTDAFQPFNIVLAIDRHNLLRNVGGQSHSFYRIPISRTTPLGSERRRYPMPLSAPLFTLRSRHTATESSLARRQRMNTPPSPPEAE